MSFKSASFPLLGLLLPLLGACESIDSERSALRSSLSDSGQLAREITTWRASLPVDVGQNAVQNLEAFQIRAGKNADTFESLSEEARAGVDLTGLQQALRAIEGFDTSTFAPASATARTSLLDQFSGLARNLQSSVSLTTPRLGS